MFFVCQITKYGLRYPVSNSTVTSKEEWSFYADAFALIMGIAKLPMFAVLKDPKDTFIVTPLV